MGEAKRRQAQDPLWGAPPVYTLCIHRECEEGETADDAWLFDVPFTVQYFPDEAKQYVRAIAVTYQIMGYLVDPESSDRIKALKLTLGNSAFLQLRSALRELPEKFWANLRDPRGELVVGRHGDYAAFSSSKDCRQDPVFVKTHEQEVTTEDLLSLAV